MFRFIRKGKIKKYKQIILNTIERMSQSCDENVALIESFNKCKNLLQNQQAGMSRDLLEKYNNIISILRDMGGVLNSAAASERMNTLIKQISECGTIVMQEKTPRTKKYKYTDEETKNNIIAVYEDELNKIEKDIDEKKNSLQGISPTQRNILEEKIKVAEIKKTEITRTLNSVMSEEYRTTVAAAMNKFTEEQRRAINKRKFSASACEQAMRDFNAAIVQAKKDNEQTVAMAELFRNAENAEQKQGTVTIPPLKEENDIRVREYADPHAAATVNIEMIKDMIDECERKEIEISDLVYKTNLEREMCSKDLVKLLEKRREASADECLTLDPKINGLQTAYDSLKINSSRFDKTKEIIAKKLALLKQKQNIVKIDNILDVTNDLDTEDIAVDISESVRRTSESLKKARDALAVASDDPAEVGVGVFNVTINKKDEEKYLELERSLGIKN